MMHRLQGAPKNHVFNSSSWRQRFTSVTCWKIHGETCPDLLQLNWCKIFNLASLFNLENMFQGVQLFIQIPTCLGAHEVWSEVRLLSRANQIPIYLYLPEVASIRGCTNPMSGHPGSSSPLPPHRSPTPRRSKTQNESKSSMENYQEPSKNWKIIWQVKDVLEQLARRNGPAQDSLDLYVLGLLQHQGRRHCFRFNRQIVNCFSFTFKVDWAQCLWIAGHE